MAGTVEVSPDHDLLLDGSFSCYKCERRLTAWHDITSKKCGCLRASALLSHSLRMIRLSIVLPWKVLDHHHARPSVGELHNNSKRFCRAKSTFQVFACIHVVTRGAPRVAGTALSTLCIISSIFMYHRSYNDYYATICTRIHLVVTSISVVDEFNDPQYYLSNDAWFRNPWEAPFRWFLPCPQVDRRSLRTFLQRIRWTESLQRFPRILQSYRHSNC